MYMRRVFNRYWYQYLFHKADNPGFIGYCGRFPRLREYLTRLKCRIKDHPNGSIYYTSFGYEPDNRCKDCGDYL